jgi:hypothetical protein
MRRRGLAYLWVVPFLLVGVLLVVGGVTADPSALTDDGYPLKPFFYILGGIFLFIPVAMLVGFALAGAARRQKIAGLVATGQQGDAVVLGLEDTGLRINGDPRVRLLLEVQIEGYTPYEVAKTLVVPLIRLSQVQAGSTVRVMADPSEPDNPDRIALLLK